MSYITKMAVTELCESIKKGELSPLEVTDAYLKSISEKDGETGAFLTVTEKQAKERAEKLFMEPEAFGAALEEIMKEERRTTNNELK